MVLGFRKKATATASDSDNGGETGVTSASDVHAPMSEKNDNSVEATTVQSTGAEIDVAQSVNQLKKFSKLHQWVRIGSTNGSHSL